MCECRWLVFTYQIESDTNNSMSSHIISQMNKGVNMIWVLDNDEIM